MAVRSGAVVGALWLMANVASGYVAANPGLTELIRQQPDRDGAFEHVVGGTPVDERDVRGRFVRPSADLGTILLVHGYDGDIDSEPLVALAQELRERGHGVLAINLGYLDGRHRYTGGHREADDIVSAVAWLERQGERVTAVWGFSAGAHAALIAATREPGIPAVVADSPFADAAAQIRSAAAATLHLPPALLLLAPVAVEVFAGDEPINVLDLDWPGTPALVISGLDDETVPARDAGRIARHTGGRLVTLPVDHTQGVLDAAPLYLEQAFEFITGNPAPLPD